MPKRCIKLRFCVGVKLANSLYADLELSAWLLGGERSKGQRRLTRYITLGYNLLTGEDGQNESPLRLEGW